MIMLVEDEKLNGEAMLITSQKGNFLDEQNKMYQKLF
jgi:hypothetical protein